MKQNKAFTLQILHRQRLCTKQKYEYEAKFTTGKLHPACGSPGDMR